MSGFFSSMFAEMGARRRRLRTVLGDRGQGLVEFLLLGALLLGSLGLLVRPWMAGVAPWGFVLPFVFVAGYLLIEARRQRALAAYKQRLPEMHDALDDKEWARIAAERRAEGFNEQHLAEAEASYRAKAAERRQARADNAETTIAASGYDRGLLFWSLACALSAVAAFVIAWTAGPHDEDVWTPPTDSVSVDISP